MGIRVKLGMQNFFGGGYFLIAFLVFFLIMGIIFGVIGVKALTEQQIVSLGNYLDLQLADTSNIEVQTIIKYAIKRNLETIIKIWFLGLTVIGLPLVLAIIFARGFALGFTVGFILENKAWQGLGFILMTILPQNIFNLPVLILAGVSAISFCFYLLSSRKREMTPLLQSFLRYTLIMFFLALIMVFVGFIEGYLTPLATSLLKN